MDSLFKRIRLPRSLVGRALVTSVGALLLVLALIWATFAAVLSWQSAPFSWEGPTSQEAEVEAAMRFDAAGRLTAIAMKRSSTEPYDVLSKDMAYQVIDGAGSEVFASPAGQALDVLRRTPVHAVLHTTRTTEGGVPLQVLTTPVEHAGNRYLIRTARSERLVSGIRSSGGWLTFNSALVTALLAVSVFTGIMLWTARRAVKPLREASAAAAAIEPTNLTQRVDSRGLPSELTPLIDAFNSALERLERGYRVQQEFLASAAHELKTPLSLMRAEIELGGSRNSRVLLQDIDYMAMQVHQLLQLAEVSEMQNFRFESLDAGAVVDETVAYVARFADGKDVHLQLVRDRAPLMIEADRGALSTLVKNLIENAVHHSSRGDIVTICMNTGRLSVRDRGPGVAPQDVAKLFTRFWRGEHATHDGAGLGLSICQSIAVAHGWTLSYRAPDDGPGAEFSLAF